jgi:hypothetical protein
MMVFTENIATLAIENRLLLPLETIFSSKLVFGMEQEQIERLVSEPASFDNDRQALKLEINTLEACLEICRRYIKPVSLLKHQRSKGKLSKYRLLSPICEGARQSGILAKYPTASSSQTSVLSVSPDIDRPALAFVPQKRGMEETPTVGMRPQQRARLDGNGDLSGRSQCSLLCYRH